MDIVATAKTATRFEFVAAFVARMTRTKVGRDVTSGLQVVKAKGGWSYGFADMPAPACEPTTPDRLYDMIRRTALNYYVQQAEALRLDALA